MANLFPKIKKIRGHWQMFALAFLLGFLVVLPTIASVLNLGLKDFRGIYPIFNDDEVHYLAMAEEVYDGHFKLGNAFYKEYKDRPFIQPSVVDILFVPMAKLFNISVPALFAINDFIFVFCGVIVLYFLFLRLTSSKNISLFFSGGFYLLFLFTFGRPINPQFSFIFLALGLLLIFKIIATGKDYKKAIPLIVFLSLITGLLLYIYPYFWTALFAVYFINVFILAIMRERSIKLFLKMFLPFLIIFFFAAIPYLINISRAVLYSSYDETMFRFGMLQTHIPGCFVNIALLVIPLFALMAAYSRVTDKNIFYYSFSLLVGAIALNWQNIITGKYLQFSSHYYQVTILFVFIVLAVIFFNLREHKNDPADYKKIKLFITLFLSIAVFAVVAHKQRNDFKNGLKILSGVSSQEMAEMQNMREIFDWFNGNMPKDSVIYCLSPEYEPFLPIYTHNNLYSYSYGGYYLMSDKEVEEKWVNQNLFEKVDGRYITEYMREIWLNKFIDVYQNQAVRDKIIGFFTNQKKSPAEIIPSDFINRVLEKHEFAARGGFENFLKSGVVDYILIANIQENKDSIDLIKKFEVVDLVKETNNQIIFRIRK
jgi:hypothetical protein